MSDKKVLLTYEGLKAREEELRILKTDKRKEVAEKIKEARGHGDLSENAEYDSAKELQAEIESKIIQLENLLRNAIIIEDSQDKEKVSLGTTVLVFDKSYDEKIKYTIVGSVEADPLDGRISNESPLGSALLGKKVGETVLVEAPDGEMVFQLLEIL